MTRETKIGLLVGLAFIIVIGILLSDHLTTAEKPPQASRVGAADNVREGVLTPGIGRVPQPLIVSDIQQVQPDRAVVMPGENRAARGIVDVAVGPRPTPAGPREVLPPSDGESRYTPVGPVAPGPTSSDDPIVRNDPPAGPDHTLATGLRKHTAEAGDTVSKMAQKYLGNKSKANQDAIIKLNPSLVQNPNKIVVGTVYSIPAIAESPAVSPTPAPAPAPVALNPTTRPAANTVSYTTKPGDNLWKIAVEQCGSASTVGQIRDLNKDVLKNGDVIHTNMKLRLPQRSSIAAAN